MGPDASLTPELIQSQAFTSAFRGYDPGEVKSFLSRVAGEIRAWKERAEHYESAWQSAEERAARPPVLDEETLVQAVGDETAAILRSARSAAAELRAKAADDAQKVMADARAEAEEILSDARSEAERLRDESRAEADRVVAEAEESSARVVTTAEAEAAEMVERARAEAASLREQAERDRQMTVDAATSTRDRILEDLARRRRVATVQIEQLRAGRERLIECYAVVRRTLEEAQSELSRADAEARAASEEVGRRMQEETEAEDPLDVAGGAGMDDSGGHAAVPAAGPGGDVPDAQEPADDGGDGPGGDGDAGAIPGPEPEGSEPGVPGATSAVDELFSRIRSGSSPGDRPLQGAQPEEDAGGTGAAPGARQAAGPEPEGAGAGDTGDGSEPEVVSDGDEALLQRRDAAVADLETTLARRLKRALQDEQNDVLDRLRNLRGEPSAEAILPPPEAQSERYARSARNPLAQAAQAGARFAAEALESDAPTEVPSVEDLAAEAASDLASGLRRRLEEVVVKSAGDDQSVLVEALGAAYREWKTQRVERLAGDVLASAFSRGVWAAVPDGTMLRWVVEDVDGPCPDCDDDALAGELPKGEAFPTGQHHPPAHSGCRCLLVPA